MIRCRQKIIKIFRIPKRDLKTVKNGFQSVLKNEIGPFFKQIMNQMHNSINYSPKLWYFFISKILLESKVCTPVKESQFCKEYLSSFCERYFHQIIVICGKLNKIGISTELDQVLLLQIMKYKTASNKTLKLKNYVSS